MPALADVSNLPSPGARRHAPKRVTTDPGPHPAARVCDSVRTPQKNGSLRDTAPRTPPKPPTHSVYPPAPAPAVPLYCDPDCRPCPSSCAADDDKDSLPTDCSDPQDLDRRTTYGVDPQVTAPQPTAAVLPLELALALRRADAAEARAAEATALLRAMAAQGMAIPEAGLVECGVQTDLPAAAAPLPPPPLRPSREVILGLTVELHTLHDRHDALQTSADTLRLRYRALAAKYQELYDFAAEQVLKVIAAGGTVDPTGGESNAPSRRSALMQPLPRSLSLPQRPQSLPSSAATSDAGTDTPRRSSSFLQNPLR